MRDYHKCSMFVVFSIVFQEAAPGELLNAKVTSLGETGAHLLIEGMVKGFLPKNHTTDGTVSLEKAFPVG